MRLTPDSRAPAYVGMRRTSLSPSRYLSVSVSVHASQQVSKLKFFSLAKSWVSITWAFEPSELQAALDSSTLLIQHGCFLTSFANEVIIGCQGEHSTFRCLLPVEHMLEIVFAALDALHDRLPALAG